LHPRTPVPMEANRSLSEGGTGRGDAIARAGSSNVTLAAEPIAAAPAPTRIKSRRVIESFAIIGYTSLRKSTNENEIFRQRPSLTETNAEGKSFVHKMFALRDHPAPRPPGDDGQAFCARRDCSTGRCRLFRRCSRAVLHLQALLNDASCLSGSPEIRMVDHSSRMCAPSDL